MQLNDGNIEILLAEKGKPARSVMVDLLLIQMTIQECESVHQLPVIEEMYQPTINFLSDLQGRLERIGLTGITYSQAHRAWIEIHNLEADLKKNT